MPVLQLAAVNIDRAALTDTVWIGLAVLAGYLAITLIFRALFRRPDISDPITAAVYSAVFLPIVFLAPGSPKLVWLAGWTLVDHPSCGLEGIAPPVADRLHRRFRRASPVLRAALAAIGHLAQSRSDS